MRCEVARAFALIAVASVAVSCAPAEESSADQVTLSTTSGRESIEVEDNAGVKTVPSAPEQIAAADTRARELLEALGVEVVGEGAEADLVIAATAKGAEMHSASGTVLDISPRDGIPLDWEMVRQAQVVGKILGREEEAAQLDEEFSAARTRAVDARRQSWKFGVVRAEGGKLQVEPGPGDALWQPVFTMLELTPAVKPEEPADARALQDAKPDFLLVSERSADYGTDGYVPPMRLLEATPPFDQFEPVKEGNVYVPPMNAEGDLSLVGYTKLFNELADQWSALA